mgnify:CR=1 FL=1
MTIETMRTIVSKSDKKKMLEGKLETLKEFKDKPGLYNGHLEITISTGPCFHDEWTDNIESNLTEEIVDIMIKSLENEIETLDREIYTLQLRLENEK